MSNPFDDPDINYTVLVNGAGQHSLWPTSVEVPAGWTIAYGPSDRGGCLDYVNENWLDIRPAATLRARAGGES
jgi:MbtH protein